MKITRIEIIYYEKHAKKMRGWLPVFVRLTTDDGLTGLGEMAPAYSPGLYAALKHLEMRGGEYLGKNPWEMRGQVNGALKLAFGHVGLIGAHVASALDMALVDLQGKAAGVPACDVLGGAVRDHARCYANGWCYNLTEPEQYAEAARKVVDDGFTALKFDPFRYDEGKFSIKNMEPGSSTRRKWLKVAMPRLEAVREEVGDEVDILLECHGKFDTPTAIWLADQCRHLDLFFMEEPVHSRNPALHREVRDSTNIPLATGERLIGRDMCRPFIETQAAAILQPDLGMAGGPVEMRKIADHAEQYDIFMAPHNAGSPVCTAASLHFDLASPNFLIQETFPYRPEDFYEFVTEPYEKKITGGYLAKPETPGLGLEVNEDFVKSQCTVLEVE